MDLVKEINRLKSEKNAIILGHYYQRPEIQDISDFIGDSLALAKEARNTTADVIVFCGVHFMAETAKILNPKKTVLLPDLEAACSLADSCKYEDLKAFKEKHPNALVISYVNCSAAVKTISDLICTSGNALDLVKKIPAEQEIIFAPDKNLGGYINRMLGRNMILWDGSCHVHNQLEAEKILLLKQKYPNAKLLAHPECTEPVLLLADFVGSTAAMLNFVKIEDVKRKDDFSKSVGYMSDLKEGIRIVKTEPSVVLVIIISCVYAAIYSPIGTYYPLITISHFHGSISDSAIVETVVSVGTLLGAFILGLIGK